MSSSGNVPAKGDSSNFFNDDTPSSGSPLEDNDEFIAIVDDTVSKTILKSGHTRHLSKKEVNTLIHAWQSKIKMFYRELQKASNKLKLYTRKLYPEVEYQMLFAHVGFFKFEQEITSAVILAKSNHLQKISGKLFPEMKQHFSEWNIDMTPNGFQIVEKFYFGTYENKGDRKIRNLAAALVKVVPNSRALEEVSCQSVLTRPEITDSLEIGKYFEHLAQFFLLMDKKHTDKKVRNVRDVEAMGGIQLEDKGDTTPFFTGRTQAAPSGKNAAPAEQPQWDAAETAPAMESSYYEQPGAATPSYEQPPADSYAPQEEAPSAEAYSDAYGQTDAGAAQYEQGYEQPAEDAPAAEGYEQPAEEPQPYEQGGEQPAEQNYEQPVEEAQPYEQGGEQPAEQNYEQPVEEAQPYEAGYEQPAEQNYEQPAEGPQPYEAGYVQPAEGAVPDETGAEKPAKQDPWADEEKPEEEDPFNPKK
jgi:hypothetical protein